jgi:NAD(P) transhydrogenase
MSADTGSRTGNLARGVPVIPRHPTDDLIVIGSGPAGQKAAFTAAKPRFRVAIVEPRQVVGGSCLHTGTIPSKTLREAVLYLTGRRLHSVYGQVNASYATTLEHIYAAGDVVGFPALASASMEQGRIAACHACGLPYKTFSELSPIGIYTIPEISMVGDTEESLTKAHVPYEFGIAYYKEIAKGHIIGDNIGMLKLLFHRDSLKLLWVHAIGERAAEIIHIGQAVMAYGGTIEYFVNTVFNYPTMAEAYKVAAFDGLNKL